MSVLIQTFVPGMTSAQYDEATSALTPLMEHFDGFLGFHTAAVVDGGLQITELWKTSEAHATWIKEVVSTKVPAPALSAMKTTVMPLHNVVLAGSSIHA